MGRESQGLKIQVSICIRESHLPLEVIDNIDQGPIYCNQVGKL